MSTEGKKLRRWVFTIHADDGGGLQAAELVIERLMFNTKKDELVPISGARGFFQLEQAPETGRLHYQGYVEYANPQHQTSLWNKFKRDDGVSNAHFEGANGSAKQNWVYCTKAESYVDGADCCDSNRHVFGAWELDHKGEPIFAEVTQGRRNDLNLLHALIWQKNMSYEELMKYEDVKPSQMNWVKENCAIRDKERAMERRVVNVEYWYGKTGVGKNYRQDERYGFENVYEVSEWANPFDDYQGEETIVLDEFSGQIPLKTMLKLLDGRPTQMKARYHNKHARYKNVLVISNEAPDTMYIHDRHESPESWNAYMGRISKVLLIHDWHTETSMTNPYYERRRANGKGEHYDMPRGFRFPNVDNVPQKNVDDMSEQEFDDALDNIFMPIDEFGIEL